MTRKELYTCLLGTLILVLGLAAGALYDRGAAALATACVCLAFVAFIGIAMVDEKL